MECNDENPQERKEGKTSKVKKRIKYGCEKKSTK